MRGIVIQKNNLSTQGKHMRISVIFLLFTGAFATSSRINAEDWTTTDGKTYKSVTVVKVEDDAVTILDSDGGALVPLRSLPSVLQRKFHYDAKKAASASVRRAQSEKTSAGVLAKEKQDELIKSYREQSEEIKRQGEKQQLAIAEKNKKIIQGNVLQKIEGGYLVNCGQASQEFDDGTPIISNAVVFFASSNDWVDGDAVYAFAYPAGRYSYLDTEGANRTVRSYGDTPERANKLLISSDKTP